MQFFSIGINNLEKNTRYQYLLLLAITLLGGALRLYKLGEWSFWTDEVFSVQDALRLNLIESVAYNEYVLSYVLIEGTIRLFGVNEFAARLGPCLVGIITIPILYFLTKEMFGIKVALVASLILTLSPWHIYWSQNARFISLLSLFSMLALFAFFWGLERRDYRLILAGVISTGLAVLSHFSAFLLVPVILSYVMLLWILPFEKPVGFRQSLILLFSFVFVLLPFFFFSPFLSSLGNRAFEFIGKLSEVGLELGQTLWLLSGIVYYIGIPTICLASFSAMFLLSKRDRATLLLVLNALVTLVIFLILSQFISAANRHAVMILPSFIVLAAFGCVKVIDELRANTKILGVAVLVLLLTDLLAQDYLYYTYQQGNRENWKAAFQFVRDKMGEDDLIVTTMPRVGEYYLGQEVDWIGAINPINIVDDGQRVWFVEDNRIKYIDPKIQEWVEDNAKLVADFDVPTSVYTYKMRVYLYDPSHGHRAIP
jgi:uncharacterized membrane protein